MCQIEAVRISTYVERKYTKQVIKMNIGIILLYICSKTCLIQPSCMHDHAGESGLNVEVHGLSLEEVKVNGFDSVRSCMERSLTREGAWRYCSVHA